MLSFLIKFLLVIFIVVVLADSLRTWQIQSNPQNNIFLNGTIPNPKPDGLYHGSVGSKTSWLGKKFDSQNSRGINLLKNKNGDQVEKYPFVTSVGKGLVDKNTDVLKIDYNIKGNPFWLKFILDEIVEVAPNEYLGKMHLRIIPGLPFSVLYFKLTARSVAEENIQIQ